MQLEERSFRQAVLLDTSYWWLKGEARENPDRYNGPDLMTVISDEFYGSASTTEVRLCATHAQPMIERAFRTIDRCGPFAFATTFLVLNLATDEGVRRAALRDLAADWNDTFLLAAPVPEARDQEVLRGATVLYLEPQQGPVMHPVMLQAIGSLQRDIQTDVVSACNPVRVNSMLVAHGPGGGRSLTVVNLLPFGASIPLDDPQRFPLPYQVRELSEARAAVEMLKTYADHLHQHPFVSDDVERYVRGIRHEFPNSYWAKYLPDRLSAEALKATAPDVRADIERLMAQCGIYRELARATAPGPEEIPVRPADYKGLTDQLWRQQNQDLTNAEATADHASHALTLRLAIITETLRDLVGVLYAQSNEVLQRKVMRLTIATAIIAAAAIIVSLYPDQTRGILVHAFGARDQHPTQARSVPPEPRLFEGGRRRPKTARDSATAGSSPRQSTGTI